MKRLALLLAGCSVADVSLDGKECPCATGYTCQVATNTCVADHGDATASCLPGTPGPLLYGSELDDLDGWDFGGGTWMAQDGNAMQMDAAAKLSFAYPHSVSAADYRIVSSFRALDGGASSALELAARIGDGGPAHQYHCNWDPLGGAFQLMYTLEAGDNGVLVSTQLDLAQLPGYDPHAPVTMELEVAGGALACCLREIPAAALATSDARFAAGHPGLKTYEMTGAYDYFHVFAAD
jgi:hypothetical protein